VAEVQVANGWSNSVERHRSELVVREVEYSEALAPDISAGSLEQQQVHIIVNVIHPP